MLPAVLPLFPLSQVALFPHTYLPLHVFEPRYQALARDVMGSHQHFILVLAKEPVTTNPEDYPPLYEAGTVARILRAEPFPDGRWNLLVQGVEVRKIIEEVPGHPYRQARHEPWPYDETKALTPALQERLLANLHRYAHKHAMETPLMELLELPLEEEARLCTFAMALDFDPVEKQFLLESPHLLALADRLSQLLEFDLGHGEGMVH